MKHQACCALLVLTTTLTGQSTGLTLSALTPLQAVITDGAVSNTAMCPVGQLPSYWGFGASLPGTSLAQAAVNWHHYHWNNGAVVRLEHVLWNPGAVPTVTASTGPHEFLVELTATAPVSADIRITRIDELAPGVGAPTVQLDYDNDGTIDVASVSTAQPLQLIRPYGPQSFQVRVIVATSLSGAEYAGTRLWLVATPHNDLTITEVVATCRPLQPSPPPFVQPSFLGRGITLTLGYYPNDLPLVVVGFSPQPALLGSQGVLPCLLLPAPQIVLFEPTGILEVPLPASLRPLTFYAQGVIWTNGELVTTEGYAVVAF